MARKRKPRNYRGWKIENFQEFYKKNYDGETIGQIRKMDRSFYFALYRRKYSDKVLPRKNRDWRNFSLDDFKNYYEKNYPGLSRAEVQDKDRSFYSYVLKRDSSDKIFPPRKKFYGKEGLYSGYSLEDFKNFHKENYSNMIRTKIFRENRRFYEAVLSRKISDEVFLPKAKNIRKSLELTAE